MDSKERVILHIDVNNAFLAFEAAFRLQHGATVDLRKIPSAVAGAQATRHGIILAKSLPAKQCGVKTGEAIWEAKQKCPNIAIIHPDYALYMCCHNALMELLKNFTDRMQIFSIDECFLDITNMKLLGDPLKTANEIKEKIKKELGFTVSIGISSNKLLAKIGSDMKKPDAITTLYPSELPEKMWPLPVEDLYMVGNATAPKLHKMGIFTIGDLARCDIEWLKYKFKSWGILLWNYANGIEDSIVSGSGHSIIKGMGNSTTIHFDVEDKETAYLVLLSLVETVGMRLRYGGFCCRVVSVTIKKAEDLTSYSHQRKLAVPVDCTNAIFEECKKLFDRMWKGEPIRHLGVRVSDLTASDSIQLSFLEKNWEKQKKVDAVIDRIRMKYGPGSIVRSGFLRSGLAPLQGGLSEDVSFPVMTSIL